MAACTELGMWWDIQKYNAQYADPPETRGRDLGLGWTAMGSFFFYGIASFVIIWPVALLGTRSLVNRFIEKRRQKLKG